MHRPLASRIAASLATIVALPASAHIAAAATAHWHAGDGWGVLAVIALTAIAAWLDRRRR
jgi:hypothetical protein